jgi:hypothetical protein
MAIIPDMTTALHRFLLSIDLIAMIAPGLLLPELEREHAVGGHLKLAFVLR